MADDYQIQRAFQNLGVLYAAEHHEGDDEGVQQVEGIVKSLRRFKQHEDQEHANDPQAVREASYDLADGRSVYYDDGKQTLKDAADLYAVLAEQHTTGSPNLENVQARHILTRLQSGDGLGEVHIATLRNLLNKHAVAIAAHRQRPQGQDLLDTATDGADARIIQPGEKH